MANELGTNIVPQYTDFNVKFTNITKDGTALNFSGVSAWIFAMSQDVATQPPTVLKASTGLVTSGDFLIDTANRTVTVSVRSSEIGALPGTWYTLLSAQVSGKRIGHRKMFITVEKQIATTGL
jgi:hypothetical protein